MVHIKKSDPVIDVVLPRPSMFSAEFQYNFFVPDESVDDNGAASASVGDDQPLNKKPRFVRLEGRTTLSNPALSLQGAGLPTIETLLAQEEVTSILDLVNNEVEMQKSALYSSINFQDLNVSDKLYNLVTTTARKRILTENDRVQENLDLAKEKFLSKAYSSQTDFVRVLRRQVPVSDDFLRRTLTQIGQLNEAFIDEEEQKEIIQDNFRDVKGSHFNGRFNSKFIGSCAQSAVNDTLGTYSEEMISMMPRLRQIQVENISAYEPNDVDPDALAVNFLSYQSAPEAINEKLNSVQFYLCGHLLEKLEVMSDGSIQRKDLIFKPLQSGTRSNATVYDRFDHIDFNVAYCRTYAYALSSLYIARTYQRASDDRRLPGYQQQIERYFLMSSPRASVKIVACQENVPPLPPEQFAIDYDSEKQKPLITWRSPLNTQRDIKKFQVLRRESIHDPFELLIEYDFDNSLVKHETLEKTLPELTVKTKRPITYFVDEGFQKGKTYIYTLRSVDAHGLLSTYGEQFSAKFNRFTNTIDTGFVSERGAPAHLPNFYLDGRLFSPTAKDSNHSRLKIYFDPEYLRLIQQNTGPAKNPQGKEPKEENEDQNVPVDLNLFRYDGQEENTQYSTARYKFQILNTDLQQSKLVDIFITDKRLGT